MNRLLLTAIVASLTSLSAHAAPTGPGSLGVIDNVPLTIGNVVVPGAFEDIYAFDILGAGILSGNAVAVNFGSFNITGLSVVLKDASSSVIGMDATPADGFSFGGLSAGSYSLSMMGTASGASGGFYGGGFIATTVPEPESYALMLAGLAAVGFMAARRRQQG